MRKKNININTEKYVNTVTGYNDGLIFFLHFSIDIDIAVDPLEGTNFAANNLPGALSVIAVSYKNNLLNAPETYMNKIAYGSDIEKGTPGSEVLLVLGESQ